MEEKIYLMILNNDEPYYIQTQNNKKYAIIHFMNYLYNIKLLQETIVDFKIVENAIKKFDDLNDIIELCNCFISADTIQGVIEIKNTDYFNKDLLCCID